jgi:hypothetical protein
MKSPLARRQFLGLPAVLFSAAAWTAPALAQPAPSLVGAWRLVSVSIPGANGAPKPYWGENPRGLIIYTAGGQMAAQLYDMRRPPLGVPWQSASADAARTAFTGLSTYFGAYSVDTRTQTVTHTVEGAMVPDWIGTKLVRRYRFLTPDRIELTVVPDTQVVTTGLVLVWQRLP